jgi:hypothetical protein
MNEYISAKGLNMTLVEMTLASIFCHKSSSEDKIDIIKDFILATKIMNNESVKSYIKLHAFEKLYLMLAISELKKLQKHGLPTSL